MDGSHNGVDGLQDREGDALLQLHIEPDAPLEVAELTAALGALARQYRLFAASDGFAREADAKLLVSSVRPGSIDIGLLPDWTAAAGLMAPLIDYVGHLTKFAGHVKSLLDLFKSKKGAAAEAVTVRDCDDAINIAKPIATHGGSQTFNIINGPVLVQPIMVMDKADAREVVEGAASARSRLQQPKADRRERVSMTWQRLDRDPGKIIGSTSPDKGLITEIDHEPHAVLFTDDMAYLKDEMVKDVPRPFQVVYFVDVEISRIGERITAYRVVGYHGKDDLAP